MKLRRNACGKALRFSLQCARDGSTETNARGNGDLICVYLRWAAYGCFLLAVLCFAESLSSLPPNTQLLQTAHWLPIAGVSIEDYPMHGTLFCQILCFALQKYCLAWRCALVVVQQVEPTMFLTGKMTESWSNVLDTSVACAERGYRSTMHLAGFMAAKPRRMAVELNDAVSEPSQHRHTTSHGTNARISRGFP